MKWGKAWDNIYNRNDRFPRKVKKKLFGIRPSHCKLRRMLKETVVGGPIKTMYERVEFTPYGAFCPKCGCTEYHGTGNRAYYPEHWEYFRCNRCYNVVGAVDNSPFVHVLECSDENYKLSI